MLWTVLGTGSTVCKMIIEFWQARLKLWRGELSQHFSGCHLFLKGKIKQSMQIYFLVFYLPFHRKLREVEEQNRELLTVAAKREETIHQVTVSH